MEVEYSAQTALLHRVPSWIPRAGRSVFCLATSLFHAEFAGSKAKYFAKSSIFIYQEPT